MRSGWIGVAAGLAFMAAMPVGAQKEFMAQAPRPTVPSVIGMTLVQARQALDAKSLQLGKVTGQVEGKVALTIVDQNPRAGDVVAAGTPVSVTLGQPQPQQPAGAGTPGDAGQPKQRIVSVPNVTGSNLVEATVVLAVYSLQLGQVTGQVKSPVAQKIVYQNPQQGARVPAGTLVAVTLEQPQQQPQGTQQPQGMFVPDLSGKTVAQAGALLSQFSLRLGAVTGQTKGTVALLIVSQSPQAGARVPLGTAVAVTLQTPQPPPPLQPQQVLVPDLIGKTVEQATASLAARSLQMGYVTGQAEGSARWKIVAQTLRAESPVAPGTAVGVTVEKPEKPPAAASGSTTSTSTTDTSTGSTTSAGHTWLWAGAGLGLVLLGVGAGRFMRPPVPPPPPPLPVVTLLAEPNVAQTRTALHVAPKIRLMVQLRGLPSPGAYDVRREASIVTREESRT